MTVHHIVLFRWKPETTREQVAELAVGLSGLPALLPSIRSYDFGEDLGLAEGNVDFAIVAGFDDEAGYREYAEHPDHLAFIRDRLRPLIAERAALQVGF